VGVGVEWGHGALCAAGVGGRSQGQDTKQLTSRRGHRPPARRPLWTPFHAPCYEGYPSRLARREFAREGPR
jgi:hypothetical protein